MDSYLPYLSLLQGTSLFHGLSEPELQELLSVLGVTVRHYVKDETLLAIHQVSRNVGIVLSGEIKAVRPAPNGTLVPIVRMNAGGVFGDVLGGSSQNSPVRITAATDCDILLIPYQRLLLLGADCLPSHLCVLQNLVRSVSNKYFQLSRRLDLLVLKTLRAKVCAYLLGEVEEHHSTTFTIPFTRGQLAEYLNCDRSALSRELSLMKEEGLLDTYRGSFKLYNLDALRQSIL